MVRVGPVGRSITAYGSPQANSTYSTHLLRRQLSADVVVDGPGTQSVVGAVKDPARSSWDWTEEDTPLPEPFKLLSYVSSPAG